MTKNPNDSRKLSIIIVAKYFWNFIKLLKKILTFEKHELTLSPLSSLWIYVVRIESLRLVDNIEDFSHIFDFVSEHRIARDVTEVRELEVERTNLWENAAATACPTIIFRLLLKKKTRNISL